MTRELALVIDNSKSSHGIHQQQLNATTKFIAGLKTTEPYKIWSVQTFDRDSTKPNTPEPRKIRSVQPFDRDRDHDQPKPNSLMRLPYDVRYEILEHIIPAQNIRAYLKRERVGIELPAIARAGSTQLRRECLLVALNSCTMEVHSGPGNARLQKWLAKVNFSSVGTSCETGFDAITSLLFPYFSYFPYGGREITTDNDVGLAVACKNLRFMGLQFSSFALSVIADECMGDFGLTATRIRENYQLDGVLEAKQLRVLRFYSYKRDYALQGLREVVMWFQKGFESKGQRVTVEIVVP